MTQISFYARGDGSTANNANLNIENSNTQPTLLLTFDSGATGDLIFESNGGLPDPDTTVFINGTQYNFTVELVGTLPVGDGKVPDALEGKTVAIISVIINGEEERFFFVTDGSGTQLLMDQFGQGAVSLTQVVLEPPPFCFCAGTRIATPTGERMVEDLHAGDSVLTESGRVVQVAWIGQSRYTSKAAADPAFRPVCIRAHALGPGLPERDLSLSPQHRVVIEAVEAELLFGMGRVLVCAHHLPAWAATSPEPEDDVVYLHLLLAEHEIVLANGQPAESFQPAQRMIAAMRDHTRRDLDEVLEVLGRDAMLARPDALPTLAAYEARVLFDQMARTRMRRLEPAREAFTGGRLRH
jgi:hypothetical protein